MARGHGCPKVDQWGGLRPSLAQRFWAAAYASLLLVGCLCALIGSATPVRCQELSAGETVRCELRIVWGGATPRSFAGSISIDDGTLQVVRNLSIQPDSIGRIQSESQTQLRLVPFSPSAFSGVDVAVSGTLNSKLSLSIANPHTDELVEHSVRLGDVLQGNWVQQLDDRGTRVAIERQVYDRIRVDSSNQEFIFNVNEPYTLRVSGYHTGLTPAEYTLHVRLLDAAENAHSLEQLRIRVANDGSFSPVDLDLRAPSADGAYKIELALHRHRLLNALVSTSSVLSRRIDLAVFDAEARPTTVVGWESIAEVNALLASRPGSLAWLSPVELRPALGMPSSVAEMTSKLQQFNPLAGSLNKPLSQGYLGSRGLANSPLASSPRSDRQLNCLTMSPGAWLAIPLQGLEPGLPHRLRLRAPSDQPMKLAVSIRQLDSAGEFAALNPDSGIDLSARECSQDGAFVHHDAIFWPNGAMLYAILFNRSETLDASVLDLTLQRAELGPSHTAELTHQNGRRVGLYLDKPLLADAFSATRELDPVTGRSLESWKTWHEAANRLGQYMSWTDANTLVVKVFADGGAVFPSQTLSPTTRFDSGTFFSDGRSPDIKDAVELLMRHCDRDGRQLVLALNLNTEFPKLSRQPLDAEATERLFQYSIDGRTLSSRASQTGGLGVGRYNPLDARFQAEVMELVRELTRRYGHHAAFAGIAIQLDGNSQLLFAGDRWGYDRVSLSEFEKHAGGKLPPREQLETVFASGAIRQAYLEWRASQLANFLAALGEQVVRVNPAAKLYLSPSRLWETAPQAGDFFNPEAIVRRPADFLLAQGISVQRIAQLPDVELMRGTFDSQTETVNSQDWIRQVAGSRVLHELSPPAKTAVMLQQATRGMRLESDASNREAAKLATAWVYPQSVAPGPWAARELIEQIYEADPLMLVTGGWLPRYGQEEQVSPVFRSLSELPAVPLKTLRLQENESNIRIRAGTHEQQAYVQIVNNAPWPERVTLAVTHDKQFRPTVLGGKEDQLQVENEASRSLSGANTWILELAPYDLLAIQVPDPMLAVTDMRHTASPNDVRRISTELSAMEQVIMRAADPTQQRILADLSGDFETWLSDGRPVGWNISSLPQVRIVRSDELPHTGRSSLKIENLGKSNVSAWIQSRGIQPPATGRLAVEAWLRVSAASDPMLVRVSVLGRTRAGARFERSVQAGGRSEGGAKLPIDWGRRPVQLFVGDIPSGELEELFVAIDLIGPGRVWVDDVQIFESTLQPEERIHLRGQLLVAKQRLSEGNPFPAEQLLSSHWGRYLAEFQTPPPSELATHPPATDDSSSADSASRWNSTTPVFQKWRESIRDRWRR